MTIAEMAREAVDLWAESGTTIEDCCRQLYGDIDSFSFGLVEEKAYEMADDESYEFAFGVKRPTTGRHARGNNERRD